MNDEVHFMNIEIDESGHSKVTNDRRLAKASITACPHWIMVPEHYREDNSCRCDDPTHTEMKEWEYEWDSTTNRWE